MDPYGDLEQRPGAQAETEKVAASRAVARGLLRRCPRCGAGSLFLRFLKIRPRCPRCGFRLEREEGGFLGAMTINYGVTTVLWMILLTGWLIIDLPDLHAMRLAIASLALMGIVPLVLWGHSKTLWAAIDYLVYRSDPAYEQLEAADRSWNS